MLAYNVVAILTIAIEGALVFAAAGHLDLPMVWVYLGVYLAIGLLGGMLVHRRNPSLLGRRLRMGRSEVPDRLYLAALGVGMLVHYVLAGLDIGRFHWSDSVPIAAQVVGLAAFVAGLWLSIWAEMANPFFVGEVRIQVELGHHVISSGPYQYMRHPGYGGGVLFMLASGVALGSWWSILPMALVIVTLIRRTMLEDAMLRERLEGYAEYAANVRYRLIPGVW